MNVLIVSVGTKGDLYPLIGLGRQLKQRGHEITILCSELYADLAENEGFQFARLYGAQENLRWREEISKWAQTQFRVPGAERADWKFFYNEAFVSTLRLAYEKIAEHCIPGETLLLCQPQVLGARIAQEKLGMPLVTVTVMPFYFQSIYQNRRVELGNLPAWMPPAGKRLLLGLGDRLLDRFLGRDLNAFRRELGLPNARKLFSSWLFSPQLVLGLFPEWFAPPQPDWPDQLQLVDFLPYVEPGLAQPTDELVRFLDAGTPPLVFTSGSWMSVGPAFFEASAEACRRLGRRGLLLTANADEVPAELPEGVVHFPFVPFSYLLPRAAALVHPGGIGAMAHAMAAGLPQLVVPVVFDHTDNAYRLEQLGVSRTLSPKRYRGEAVARELKALLADASVAAACRRVKALSKRPAPLDQACDAIERLLAQPASSHSLPPREQQP